MLAENVNPVHRANEDFPGGPKMLWIILGTPMLLIAGYLAYAAFRSTVFGERYRRKKQDKLERKAATRSLELMEESTKQDT